MTWKQIDNSRYDEMCDVMPPIAHTSSGFLMGEPMDHNAEGRAMYMAFVAVNGKRYECSEPLTVAQFRAVNLATVGA